MAVRKAARKPASGAGPKGPGPGRGTPRRAPQAKPKNPCLEALISRCSAGGTTGMRMRKAAIDSLDDIISDRIALGREAGCTTDGFWRILDAFARGVADDRSCPLYHVTGGPEMRHLLLMVLMDVRGGPVRDGMAVIFDLDRVAASQYISYARSVCLRTMAASDNMVAWIMYALDGGAYEKIERIVPGFELLVGFNKTSAAPGGGTREAVNMMVILTERELALDIWQVPQDCTGNMEAFRRYVSGRGRYLKEMTRQMPGGRRWTISHGMDDRGILELLPEVDVSSLN